ncbi:hypothetical protein YDYSY3_02120 [Paenibacillus chitinolyticus]|nr:hypothetical protein YDYSY3_02120 [Paenibacillus chitinolyticus]
MLRGALLKRVCTVAKARAKRSPVPRAPFGACGLAAAPELTCCALHLPGVPTFAAFKAPFSGEAAAVNGKRSMVSSIVKPRA